MIKAVLLDLDDTLLKNPTEAFVAEYLRLMDAYFVDRWGYSTLSKVILTTARDIIGQQPRDSHLTNADLMQEALVEATGRPNDEVRQAFRDFHATTHAALQRCTETRPEASALIRYLTEKKYAVVIATNPIFAPEAVFQRLAWAGLPDKSTTYALVTHSENMHFAKPDPAYYAEILARISVEPDEAVMVGDSIRNDIVPAAQLGLNTFLIQEGQTIAENGDGSGILRDFYENISEKGWLDTLIPRPLQPAMIEPELRGNIGALFGLLSEVKPHQWNQHPDAEEWSILQIVCHLLESERAVQRPRLQRILAEADPFLAGPRPPAGPREAVACSDDGMTAGQFFADERQQTIDWLWKLEPQDWQRKARHSIFGPTTMLEMAHFTAQHDRLHLNQICRTLGRCD